MENENLYYVMNEMGRDLVDELKKRLTSLGKNASGNLINSLGYNVVEIKDGWEVQLSSDYYLKYVDEGRKPGKMPPINKIVPWVESKGIKMNNKSGGIVSSESAAYVIARSIGRKGIKPTDVLQPTTDYVYDKYRARIQEAVIKDMSDTIKNIFDLL